VVILIAVANVVPFLAIPGFNGNLGVAIVALAALLFALVRSFARLPARRQWLAEAFQP
jgi:hypothetical protein